MSFASPLLSRLAAIGVLLAVVGLLWLGAIAPLRAAFVDLAEERARLVELKQRYRRAAANIETLRKARDEARGRKLERSDLITAGGAAAAAAQMQSDVKRALEEAGGQLRRAQVEPAESGEGLERVQLRVLASIDLPGLTALLHALEIEDRRYRVGDLRIDPDRSRRAAEQGKLTVRFDLVGYRRREGGGAPGGRPPAPALRRLGDG